MNIEILLTAITALTAVIIGAFSIYFTRKSIEQQQAHNKNSVVPICNIRLWAPKNKVAITVHNVGTGPMRIKKLVYLNKSGEESKTPYSFLSDWMPEGCTWISVENIDLEANGTINLLQFKQKGGEEDTVYENDRFQLLFKQKGGGDDSIYESDRLRLLKGLGTLTLYVEYEDVYGEKTEYETDLKFFYTIYQQIIEEIITTTTNCKI